MNTRFNFHRPVLLMLDAEQFLGMTTTEASVKPPLIPVNDEGYMAQIAVGGLGWHPFQYKKGDRQGQTGYRMTVKWEILDEATRVWCQEKNRAPFITQSILVNVTPGGALAPENRGLRDLREAVGQNKDGQPWSPTMLIGQSARIAVGHRISDTGDEMEEVTKVTKL